MENISLDIEKITMARQKYKILYIERKSQNRLCLAPIETSVRCMTENSTFKPTGVILCKGKTDGWMGRFGYN